MEKRSIKSTSLASARCTDLVLRETLTTRLVFRPQLVDNPKDSAAAVHGTFLFLKKGRKDEWEDTVAISLSSLKKGEGVKLDLHASEILALFSELRDLYKVHAKVGIPLGETELVRADSVIARLAEVPRDQLRDYLSANKAVGEEILSTLLAWATEVRSPSTLVPRLVSLGAGTFQGLNAAIGLEALKRSLTVWEENTDNPDEEFWQRTFTEHSFVLEQVFSWPITIVKGKAYVGGKSVLNIGGNIVDFLVKNDQTSNAALVEIKTPKTQLMGSKYRDGVYNPSEELTGSVMQVMNYRHSLQSEFIALQRDLPSTLKSFEPRCVLIIGNTHELNENEDKLKSFELFRSQSSLVAVMTYDEIFAKTRRLVELLEGASSEGNREAEA